MPTLLTHCPNNGLYTCMHCESLRCMRCHLELERPTGDVDVWITTAVRWCPNCIVQEAITNRLSMERLVEMWHHRLKEAER